MSNTITNSNKIPSLLLGLKEITPGAKLNMTHLILPNGLLKPKRKLMEPITLSCNKDKIIITFNHKCKYLKKMKLLKNTTKSILSKLPLTTTTDCLKLAQNTITNGKPNR